MTERDFASQYALRPMLPQDGRRLAEIFRASVEALTGDEYSREQQAAWASSADDEQGFAARLAAQLTLVATHERMSAGFASLKGENEIDFLYVHPDHARRGVGAKLMAAVERLAAARGAKALSAEVSDSATGFFAKLGYTAQQRNTVMRNGEWLSNTTMTKALGQPAAVASQETRRDAWRASD